MGNSPSSPNPQRMAVAPAPTAALYLWTALYFTTSSCCHRCTAGSREKAYLCMKCAAVISQKCWPEAEGELSGYRVPSSPGALEPVPRPAAPPWASPAGMGGPAGAASPS